MFADFVLVRSKARKQGFQAKIWMQKSSARPVFFQINFKCKFDIIEKQARKRNEKRNENEKKKRKPNKKRSEKKGTSNIFSQTNLSLGDTTGFKRLLKNTSKGKEKQKLE